MADIFQIIKYEGDNSTFIWKSPIEDFNTGSHLIVHESQEAIFFMNGQALDLFGPGRHILETQNIPLLKKFLNKPTNDQSPFHCEVYFINKTEQMSIKWGTDSQVQYMEPTYKFPLKIGASGEMFLRVEDSRKILVKVVGTEQTLTQAALTQKFRAFLMARIKPYLAKTMQNSEFGIFEVDSHMDHLSEVLHQLLIPDFSDYGVSLEKFFVTTIVKPDGDTAYEKFRDLHIRQYSDVAEATLRQKVGIIDQQTEAQRKIIESAALAQKRAQEGYSYQQERQFDVLGAAASNEGGAGQMMGAGMGLGMGVGIGGAFGQQMGNIAGVMNQPGGVVQQPVPGVGFQTPVPGVGVMMPTQSPMPAQPFQPTPTPITAEQPTPVQPQQGTDDLNTFKQKLEKLKMMKDMEMISNEEFEIQKKQLLSSL